MPKKEVNSGNFLNDKKMGGIQSGKHKASLAFIKNDDLHKEKDIAYQDEKEKGIFDVDW